MSEELNTRLMCARAQAELIKAQVSQITEGGAKGRIPTPAMIDPARFRPEWTDDFRPYVPQDLFPAYGKGGPDIRKLWHTDAEGRVNLYKSLQDNLDEIEAANGGAKGRVANNSLEASDNMIDNISKATRAARQGDFGGAVRHGGRAIGDLGQVYGHLSAGN